MKLFFCKISVLFALCVGLGSLSGMAQNQRKTPPEAERIKELTHEWLVYDKANELYVPFVPDFHLREKAIYLHLIEPSFFTESQYLCFRTSQKGSLYINQRFTQICQANEWHNIRLDSLVKLEPSRRIYVTLFFGDQKTNTISPPSTFVLQEPFKVNSENSEEQARTLILQQNEEDSIFKKVENRASEADHFIILFAFLSVFIISTGLNSLHLVFSHQAIRQIINALNAPKSVTKRLDVPLVFSYSAFYALLTCLLLMILVRYGYFFGGSQDFSLSGWAWRCVWVILLCLAAVLIKYLTLRFFSYLFFSKAKLADWHFWEYIHISLIFMNALMVILFLYLTVVRFLPANATEVLLYLLGILFVLRIVILGFRLIPDLNGHGIYLFSYLCSTELLPSLGLLALVVFI
ncbi:MAG: DUF4271 domain-containing protein [Cytophagales bacterium]|nr:MAG: DUF4271 domain-containing protein [Cytophagales bacterium]TAF59970.1 MAG: DUF4271 domain-containing protein [Cytophagales bacterium]